MYEACLRLISHLQELDVPSIEESPVDLFLALASFTHPEDSWTTQASYEQANDLLYIYLKPLRTNPEKLETLLTSLLREKVKVLFSKSKNPSITEAGRKAIFPLPAPMEHSIDETDIKPWKYRDIYIVTVFEWILKHLDVRSLNDSLPNPADRRLRCQR